MRKSSGYIIDDTLDEILANVEHRASTNPPPQQQESSAMEAMLRAVEHHVGYANRAQEEALMDAIEKACKKPRKRRGPQLSNEDVVNLLARLRAGERPSSLARQFEISTVQIWRIKTGKSRSQATRAQQEAATQVDTIGSILGVYR